MYNDEENKGALNNVVETEFELKKSFQLLFVVYQMIKTQSSLQEEFYREINWMFEELFDNKKAPICGKSKSETPKNKPALSTYGQYTTTVQKNRGYIMYH